MFYREFYGFLMEIHAVTTPARSLLNCKCQKRRCLIAAARLTHSCVTGRSDRRICFACEVNYRKPDVGPPADLFAQCGAAPRAALRGDAAAEGRHGDAG